MQEDWKKDLIYLFTEYDLSSAVLERNDGKDFQFGGIAENKQLFKKVSEKYSYYFSKPGDLGACLIYLKTHSLEELLDKLECPVCHKFNATFRMNRSRGDEHFFCSKECRYSKAGAALNMQHYKERTGYDNPYSNPEVVEKRRKNFYDKYGVNTPMELEEFKNKNFENNKKNHGGMLACQTDEVKSSIKETNCKNHDGIHNLQLKEAKDRLKEVSLEKYGTEYPIQNKYVRERQIEIYGGCGLASEEIRKRAENTFGGKLNSSNPKIFEKIVDTVENKSGKSFKEAITDRFQNALKKKYGNKVGFANKEVSDKIKEEVLRKHGVPYFCMTEECREASKKTISKKNQDFAEKLRELGFNVGLDSVKLDTFSYDVCLEDDKILFEIDPTFTHNSTWNPYGSIREFDYHLRKTEVAKNYGYRCIHVWDWEDKNKIISLICHNTNVYARNCEIRKIELAEANLFLEINHLQGGLRNQEYCYGLFFENKLVEVMTFGKPRYTKRYQYELLRLCTLNGVKVIGGANKLFKHFVDEVKPESIVSYCDNSKFNGEVYLKLEMKLVKQTKPSCHWVRKKEHYTDNLLRQQGADRLIGTSYGKDTNNEEIMLNEGFVKVFDCGQLVFDRIFE